jgi:hypothetical protein
MSAAEYGPTTSSLTSLAIPASQSRRRRNCGPRIVYGRRPQGVTQLPRDIERLSPDLPHIPANSFGRIRLTEQPRWRPPMLTNPLRKRPASKASRLSRFAMNAFAFLVLASSAWSQQSDVPAELAARIDCLSQQLDDDKFDVREKAEAELAAIGEPARAKLTVAAKDNVRGAEPARSQNSEGNQACCARTAARGHLPARRPVGSVRRNGGTIRGERSVNTNGGSTARRRSDPFGLRRSASQRPSLTSVGRLRPGPHQLVAPHCRG